MARSKRNTRRKESAPGWLWMLLGIGIGLVIAGGVYYRTAWQPSEPKRAPQPAAANGVATPPAATPGKPAAQNKGRAAPSAAVAATPVATPDRRFEFYDILPQYEVVVPEVESVVGAGAARVKPIQEPGSYVLQAGSFGAAADADKVKASIALLGVESRIQRVTVDDAVFHRVRIGPIRDLAELNRVRKRLHDAHIDAVVMKAME
jgi:cell division protein FtsN